MINAVVSVITHKFADFCLLASNSLHTYAKVLIYTMRIKKKLKIRMHMRTYAFAKVGICRHAAYEYQNLRIFGCNLQLPTILIIAVPRASPRACKLHSPS